LQLGGKVPIDETIRGMAFSGFFGSNKVQFELTERCFVSLERPMRFIALEDVELVSFERVIEGLPSFDLSFVFKDYERRPLQVSEIQKENLLKLQRHLNRYDVSIFATGQEIGWKYVLMHICNDRRSFLRAGGWQIIFDEFKPPRENIPRDEESFSMDLESVGFIES